MELSTFQVLYFLLSTIVEIVLVVYFFLLLRRMDKSLSMICYLQRRIEDEKTLERRIEKKKEEYQALVTDMNLIKEHSKHA